MQYVMRLQRADATPTAVVRRRVPADQLSRVVPEACGTVWTALKTLGVSGAGRHLAVYLNCADGQVEVEIGVELERPFAGGGEVVASATPAGRVVSTTHLGPYPRLGEAHDAVRDWCKAQNLPLAGPNWEVYGHWDPAWDKDPSQIRTDVFYLLRN